MAEFNFNVSNFVSAMSRDGARPNLFKVELPGYTTQAPSVNKGLEQTEIFKMHSTQIPGISVGMVGAFYCGRQVKFSGTQTFQNWAVTIIMDEDDYKSGRTRGYFEEWLSALNSHENNSRAKAAIKPSFTDNNNSYWRDGHITHLGKDGSTLAKYKMWGCFPVGLSPIELSWGANDSIAQFQIEFAVQYWTREDSGNKLIDENIQTN